MSSILKALKKIETDSQPPDEFTSWPQQIDTKTAVNYRARKRWYYRKLATQLLTVVIILAVAVLIFSQRKFIAGRILSAVQPGPAAQAKLTTNSDGVRVFRAKIDPAQLPRSNPIPRSPVIGSSGLSKTGKQSSTERRPSPAGPADRTQTRIPATAAPIKKVPPPDRNALPKTPPQPSGGKSEAGRQEIVRNPKASSPSKKMTVASKSEVQYDRLADAEFKLQAIAWFDEAAKRLAVINGRIIREGESVNGYTVRQIRPDDVLVNDGSNTWRVEFGLKP